jgi:hypothetical protein
MVRITFLGTAELRSPRFVGPVRQSKSDLTDLEADRQFPCGRPYCRGGHAHAVRCAPVGMAGWQGLAMHPIASQLGLGASCPHRAPAMHRHAVQSYE